MRVFRSLQAKQRGVAAIVAVASVVALATVSAPAIAELPRRSGRHHLSQPGAAGLSPGSERRAGGRVVLSREQLVRDVPGRAHSPQPRPRELGAARARAHARFAAAAGDRRAVGRDLGAHHPPSRGHVLHGHDQLLAPRELLRHRQGSGGAVVRAGVDRRAPGRHRSEPVLRRRRQGVPDVDRQPVGHLPVADRHRDGQAARRRGRAWCGRGRAGATRRARTCTRSAGATTC